MLAKTNVTIVLLPFYFAFILTSIYAVMQQMYLLRGYSRLDFITQEYLKNIFLL
jgi:hypothetical protein